MIDGTGAGIVTAHTTTGAPEEKMAQILIVEDDLGMRRSLSMALEHAGHKVHAVSNGVEAMAALPDQHFDLLLTDIIMPDLDGVEMARQARTHDPELRVTFITGFAVGAELARVAEIDGARVIAKPFSLAELVDKINDMLLH